MIYLDNAATTLQKPPCVAEAVARALGTLGNSARGAHAGAMDAARRIYGAREKLAALLGCKRADHVVFTANVTQALNLALYGLLDRGDRAVATDWSHNSSLRPLYRLREERGVAVDFVPADARGRLDYDDFDRLITPKTKLVMLTHASNLTGDLPDERRVADIAHARGALVVLDAAQTAGARRVQMDELGVDVLCFTGHKGLYGPQGTGGLCLREGVDIRPVFVGGTGVQTYSPAQPEQYPTRLEAGTLNGHGIAGLSAAVDWLNETGVETIRAHEAALTRRFYEGARAIDGVTVYGDFSGEHAPIVALNLCGVGSGELADALAEDYGIAVRAGAHCAPRLHEALGTREQGAVRFSFSYFNTAGEIDAALDALRELAGR